jgi:hypothetical protein
MQNSIKVHTKVFPLLLTLTAAVVARSALAQIQLPPVTVTAPRPVETAPTDAASERRVSGETIIERPIGRPGEALEAAPGLIVTQHSGEGKANQYFLRGFNLDHGTDIAITLDGMPLNMRTHGHGQGYADANFLIPELIDALGIRKGPYWADSGDFSSAGALSLSYVDKLEKSLVGVTGGSFGYWRGLAAGSLALGQGTLTAAGEATFYDGPWQIPDATRKFNGFLRYSEGARDDGFALTAMAYTNSWHSTDQIPQRAVLDGSLDRFAGIDPTDGGDAQRYSLSARWSRKGESSQQRLEAYAIYSTLNLYNNFTFFLNDPVNGDQFQQTDKRWVLGFNASHAFQHTLGGFATDSKVGLQVRYDDIKVGLFNTFQRTALSTVRDDHVREASVGLYGQMQVKWTDWLRTNVGLRGDLFTAAVASDTPANAGNVTELIASPKFGVVLGPWAKTELFFNAGLGFHSNDARGATITVDPADKTTPQPRVPLLVRSTGAEIGARTQAVKGLDSAVTLFLLDFDSEILFVGDAGTTEPSRPSRRVGIEWTNHYRPLPWLLLDVDLAWTRARFTNVDPSGDFIPGAPNFVGSAGLALGASVDGEPGWYGGVRLRHFGPRPLIEDNSVQSDATTLVNARLGYLFEQGVRLQLDVLNLLKSRANQIDYYYQSQLRSEAAPVADRHFHPVEPLAVRLTLLKQF